MNTMFRIINYIGDDFEHLNVMGLLAAFAASLAFFLFNEAYKDFRWRRVMQDIPSSKIRGAALGSLVEIKGKALPVVPLYSPVSGKSCVYYKYSIAEAAWSVPVISGMASAPFMVDDGTGLALVYGGFSKENLEPDIRFTTWDLDRPPENVELSDKVKRYLKKGDRLSAKEAIIETGDDIYVLGAAQRIETEDFSDIRDIVESLNNEQLRDIVKNLSTHGYFNFESLGLNTAGVIDKFQRLAFPALLHSESIGKALLDAIDRLSSCKLKMVRDKTNGVFLVADSTERQLTKKMSALSIGKLIMGSFGVVASCLILLYDIRLLIFFSGWLIVLALIKKYVH